MVFSRAQEVVLLQNGAETARAQAGAATLPDLPLSFVFEVPYTPGKLEAVSYQDGREISRDALETTGAPAALRLTAEGALRADGHSVACVWAEVVDAAGRVVPNAAPALTAGLSGAGTLAGFGSANPITTDNYAAGPLPGLPRPRAGCGARRVRDRQRDPDRDRRGPAHRQPDTGRSPRGRRGLTAVPHEPHQAARLTPHGLPLNVQMLPAVQHDTAKVESPAQSRRPMLRSCFSLRCDGL